mgnify:FL=1
MNGYRPNFSLDIYINTGWNFRLEIDLPIDSWRQWGLDIELNIAGHRLTLLTNPLIWGYYPPGKSPPF